LTTTPATTCRRPLGSTRDFRTFTANPSSAAIRVTAFRTRAAARRSSSPPEKVTSSA
jgi:hypothetical protein